MAAMETVEGKVLRINGNGFQITGRDGWLNISKFADACDVPTPKVGDVVKVKLDKSGYVRWIRTSVPEAQPEPEAETEPQPEETQPTERPCKDVIVTRLAVLNTATSILSSGGRATDADAVIALAARLEAWATR